MVCWSQVLVSDPKELDKIREREFDITKERIQKILNAGANVILTTKGIDDMSLKYFVEGGRHCLSPCPQGRLEVPCSNLSLRVSVFYFGNLLCGKCARNFQVSRGNNKTLPAFVLSRKI